MPATACTRCFAVFHTDDARPGAAPLCPACAAAHAVSSPAIPVPAFPPDAAPAPARRRLLLRLGVAAVVLAALAALAGAAVAAGWIVL